MKTQQNKREKRPPKINNLEYFFDSYGNRIVPKGKKVGRLPAMGWNSWNAFGSNNTEALTMAMADKIVELGLDKLGYQYVVLDDGCYLPKRVKSRLANEPVKFPSGFKALADYVHGKGLKFGMYNDIGTNLCAGAAVGTCGHEEKDAESYVNWGVDFLKVDNCYYPWDNATFSDATNAKYVYAPRIKKVALEDSQGKVIAKEQISEEQFLEMYGENGIGTYDGTGPERTPLGRQSSEYVFAVEIEQEDDYQLEIDAVCGEEVGCGSWMQIKVDPVEASFLQQEYPKTYFEVKRTLDNVKRSSFLYDDFWKQNPVPVHLTKGCYAIRLMNHRRQENTTTSYGRLLKALNKVKPDHNILLSICEWGKTQPQNWGYKVGDSWRILNDITFRVGDDGDPGYGTWNSDYTTGVTAQYNKAVIMHEFAGLDKGWNDPDMLMIGMNGLDMTMNRTHMTMWCMMNSPLMLGLDLRRVQKGDEIYQIIANEAIIALNQDPLGVQARRVCVYSFDDDTRRHTDREYTRQYIRNNNRIDILAKPLLDKGVAVSFINLGEEEKTGSYYIRLSELEAYDVISLLLKNSDKIRVENLWSGESVTMDYSDKKTAEIRIAKLLPHDQVTFKISVAD